MISKIKNIIIFVIVAAVLILAYIFFFKKDPEESSLIVSQEDIVVLPSVSVESANKNNLADENFLSTLLNVKNIKLDDSIFTDIAFATLYNSSIELVPDHTEGRPNPFAPIGTDILLTNGTQAGILTPAKKEELKPEVEGNEDGATVDKGASSGTKKSSN